MLKICSNNELAGELKSALLRFTDYFVETKEASRDDVTEILQYSQENVANLISRLELSLNEEECNNLAEGSKLRIAYYTEITTYNN